MHFRVFQNISYCFYVFLFKKCSSGNHLGFPLFPIFLKGKTHNIIHLQNFMSYVIVFPTKGLSSRLVALVEGCVYLQTHLFQNWKVNITRKMIIWKFWVDSVSTMRQKTFLQRVFRSEFFKEVANGKFSTDGKSVLCWRLPQNFHSRWSKVDYRDEPMRDR